MTVKELFKKNNYKSVVVFQNDERVVYMIGYEGYPNVSSLKDNFEELQKDEQFGVGESALDLRVIIIDIEDFNRIFEDVEVNINEIKIFKK